MQLSVLARAETIEWDTNVSLDSVFVVKEEDTLTVRPNVVVTLFDDAYISVFGTVHVNGESKDTVVTFIQYNSTSLRTIQLQNSNSSLFVNHSKFYQVPGNSKSWAIRVLSGSKQRVSISDTEFISGTGVYTSKSNLLIERCTFTNVSQVLSAYSSSVDFLDNVVTSTFNSNGLYVSDGNLTMQRNIIYGASVELLNCVNSINIINNTITQKTKQVIYVISNCIATSAISIRDNVISTDEKVPYISLLQPRDIEITGNTLSTGTKSSATYLIYVVCVLVYPKLFNTPAIHRIANNLLIGGFVDYTSNLDNDQLLFEGNTMIGSTGEYAVSVSMLGVLDSITLNTFKKCSSGLLIEASVVNVTNNIFEDGDKALSLYPYGVMDTKGVSFIGNRVARYNGAIISKIIARKVTGNFTISGNLFEDSPPGSDFLINMNENSGSNIDISRNQFVNNRGSGMITVSAIFKEMKSVTIQLNTFTGGAHDTIVLHTEDPTKTPDLSIQVSQNIFDYRNEGYEISVIGKCKIDASYNYWTTKNWRLIKSRVYDNNDVSNINLSPFFLSDNIENFNKNNLGYSNSYISMIIIIVMAVSTSAVIIGIGIALFMRRKQSNYQNFDQ
jgi:hypothetical protein